MSDSELTERLLKSCQSMSTPSGDTLNGWMYELSAALDAERAEREKLAGRVAAIEHELGFKDERDKREDGILCDILAAGKPTPAPPASDIADMVCADILARKAMGTAKYGVPLRAGNGRYALRDMYEELLDAAHYCKQAIVERHEGRGR